MIEIRNIKKLFGDKVVLEDVSGVMSDGKCNLIIGSVEAVKLFLQSVLLGF